MTALHRRPERGEAADYYFKYIDLVPGDDVVAVLERQAAEVREALGAISEEHSLSRYAEDKWSIREVVGHINDCERLFTFRAFWFARGFDSPLPSFDQNAAVAGGAANDVELAKHVAEFAGIREATWRLFASLPAEAWERNGVASGSPVSVRALAFLAAGHVSHHLALLNERYR